MIQVQCWLISPPRTPRCCITGTESWSLGVELSERCRLHKKGENTSPKAGSKLSTAESMFVHIEANAM
jgi:hypothetical protein